MLQATIQRLLVLTEDEMWKNITVLWVVINLYPCSSLKFRFSNLFRVDHLSSQLLSKSNEANSLCVNEFRLFCQGQVRFAQVLIKLLKQNSMHKCHVWGLPIKRLAERVSFLVSRYAHVCLSGTLSGQWHIYLTRENVIICKNSAIKSVWYLLKHTPIDVVKPIFYNFDHLK